MKETSTASISYNEKAHLTEYLKQFVHFRALGEAGLQALLMNGRLREYSPGEHLIREKEFDSWVFVLLEGRAQVWKQGHHIGHIAKPGALIGEMSIIDGSARSASILADTKTVVLAIDAAVLDRKYKERNFLFLYVIYRLFAEVLAERLRETTATVQGVAEQIRPSDDFPRAAIEPLFQQLFDNEEG